MLLFIKLIKAAYWSELLVVTTNQIYVSYNGAINKQIFHLNGEIFKIEIDIWLF